MILSGVIPLDVTGVAEEVMIPPRFGMSRSF
jgi:hypothetical protein